jgi:hypothetical protein
MTSDSFQALLDEIKAEYSLRDFSEQEAKEQFRKLPGNLFLSHTSADAEWCRRVVLPVIRRTYWSCFFLSLGAFPYNPRLVNAYRVVVEYAFLYSKTVVIAVSEASLRSTWARLEAHWAVDQHHPIIVCMIDDVNVVRLNRGLALRRWLPIFYPPFVTIDFFRDEATAQRQLGEVLQRKPFLAAEHWCRPVV